MKIEINSKVEVKLDRDIRRVRDKLNIHISEFSDCYNKITNYCSVLRLFITYYPWTLIQSCAENQNLVTKVTIESHSGSMKIDDSVLIREFNILIEEILNKYKYITWNLIIQ